MVVATMQAAHVRQAARQSSEQPPSQTMPATMIAAYFAFLFVGNVGDQLANTLGGLQEASRVADTMWDEGRCGSPRVCAGLRGSTENDT